MARPRSEDKRNAILSAATRVIAEQGLRAPTSKIAKLAGVAEGSLFTYFSSKDELLNHLYVELKTELATVMVDGYPAAASVRDRARHTWLKYVAWGVANPQKRKAMSQLAVSDRITDESRQLGQRPFGGINDMITESIACGALNDHPPAFVAAIMGSLAETTMDFMLRDPDHAERYSSSGFEAFWSAIAKG